MVRPISEETRQKIIEAHELRLPINKTAESVGVTCRTILKYWKAAELKPHFTPRRRILEETRQKIIEAHGLNLSMRKAAERADVNRETVSNYWKAAGLEPHFKKYGRSKQNLIYAAGQLQISAKETAEFLDVSAVTVYMYWRRLGLALPRGYQRGLGRFIKAGLTNLLDDVFNTVKNPNEQLELEQIVQRLKKRLGTERINVKDLQEKIDKLVGWGYYAVAQDGGKTYYKAGMPAAMDGNFKAAVAR